MVGGSYHGRSGYHPLVDTGAIVQVNVSGTSTLGSGSSARVMVPYVYSTSNASSR